LAVRYDTAKIFDAEGAERNSMVLENVKVAAVWNLIKRFSAEMLYDVWKGRYDRVVDNLKLIAAGGMSPDLPLQTDKRGEVINTVRSGSHRKFEHYY
jgi:hypothetical protein